MTASKMIALCAVSTIALTRDGEAPAEQLTRELAFDVRSGTVDDKARTVELTFSSEEPYERWWGTEILDHRSASVRLGRLNAGGALLMDHDSRDQVGVIERAWIKGGKGHAVVRFGRSARAQEIFEDVKDGIRKLVSVGYRILELARERSDAGEEVYRATDWEPYEISLVAVPADPSVGVGRDGAPAGFDPRTLLEKDNDMRFARNAGGSPAPAPAPADPHSDPMTPGEARRAERARLYEFQEIADRLKLPSSLLRQAIKEGWDKDEFCERIIELQRRAPAIRTADEFTSARDDFESAKGQFSLSKAIAELSVPGGQLTGREAEVSQELTRIAGKAAKNGVYVPLGVLSEQRTQLVGTPSIGGNLVGDDLREDQFIDPLRRRSAIMQTGATVLSDLVGDAVLPRQTNVVTGEWIAEDAAGSETDLTFDQIVMQPKTVTGRISWSRQMALQSTPAIERLARQDLSEQLALALDLAAINGPGTGNQPRGILNTAGIGAVVGGVNGAALNYGHLVDMETQVANANADMGAMAYLVNSRTRGHCKKTVKFGSGTEEMIWEEGNRLNRYPAYVSNNVPSNLTKGTASGTCSAVIFGNWSELLIGLWGGLDLLVDPYTHSDRGRVRITAFMSADISVRRAASFCAMVDALTPAA